MKASDLFAKALQNEGVSHIFGIPGEETIDLLDSISRTDIQFIVTRHEQGAAFMADAYGRISRKPGVCLSTLGPGATNLVTGVANAQLDHSPVVAITGQASRDRLHKESHQNVDTISLFSGITKYNRSVIGPESIPEIVRKAFFSSTWPQPGASHIQLPEDVARMECDEIPMLPVSDQTIYEANGNLVRQAAKLINMSKNPIIIGGNGIIRNEAWLAVRDFVETSRIPFVSTFMAKGILPYDHDRNLFVVGGKPFEKSLRPLISSDLVIAIGFDMVEYDPAIWNKDSTRKIVNIDITHSELDEHFPVEYDLVGNIAITLNILKKHVERRKDTSIHDEIRKRRKDLFDKPGEGIEKIPKQIMKTLTDLNDQKTMLISDVGLHKVWVSRYYQPAFADRTIIYNGFASMGASLPASIAVDMARPGMDIVAVSGDGGFLMNVQELETANRLNSNFTVIVFNDGRYSLIEKKEIDSGMIPHYIEFTNPDFEMLARSFHCTHYYVDRGEDFRDQFIAARKENGVKIIEVKI